VDKADITAALAVELIAAQFPQWAGLPVRKVEVGGWDHATFRLGDDKLVRLPHSEVCARQVDKEQRWLPVLGPRLPLPIPRPLGRGAAGRGFPWPWSVYAWLDGGTAEAGPISDLAQFAADLTGFLNDLYRVDPAGGPVPGEHNFFLGGPPRVKDGETRSALAALEGHIDTRQAREVWETALDATCDGDPVWFHGDVQPGNLLVTGGRLSAVIDFGGCGTGDPACDGTIAWTFLTGEGRRVFRAGLPFDAATWARARGWAIWKAMKVLAGALRDDPADAAFTAGVIDAILADHRAVG
jgi:aminoglycoside phosphotransferase (APT) family kinase protein